MRATDPASLTACRGSLAGQEPTREQRPWQDPRSARRCPRPRPLAGRRGRHERRHPPGPGTAAVPADHRRPAPDLPGRNRKRPAHTTRRPTANRPQPYTRPIKHDRDSGTHQIQVRLARGPLRPLLRMRLNIDRWSPSTTALELIPAGRIRPTAAYFRAGHLLLDTLARSLPQQSPAAHPLGGRAPTARAAATGAGALGGMGVTPKVAAGATRVESVISGMESLGER